MGVMYDNYDAWKRHDDRRESELAKRPKCDECGNHIQDDHYYIVGNQNICPDCLETYYRVETDDYTG